MTTSPRDVWTAHDVINLQKRILLLKSSPHDTPVLTTQPAPSNPSARVGWSLFKLCVMGFTLYLMYLSPIVTVFVTLLLLLGLQIRVWRSMKRLERLEAHPPPSKSPRDIDPPGLATLIAERDQVLRAHPELIAPVLEWLIEGLSAKARTHVDDRNMPRHISGPDMLILHDIYIIQALDTRRLTETT